MANTAQRCFYWHSRVSLVKRFNSWHLNKYLLVNAGFMIFVHIFRKMGIFVCRVPLDLKLLFGNSFHMF